MGISIDPTPPLADRSGIAKPAVVTIGRLLAGIVGITSGSAPHAAGHFVSASESGFEAIKAFRSKKATPESRAWTLWRESLALTMIRFFETASLTRKPEDQELSALLDQVIETTKQLCNQPKIEMTRAHLQQPTDFPLYPALREKLPGFAKEIAPDHLRDDEWLKRCLERGKACRSEEEKREPDVIHIGWLMDELMGWLKAGRSDDALRVVSGGPGSGKSSSAKMLARKVAFDGHYNVFLLPVQGLDVDRPIDAIIDDYLQQTRGRVGALGGNPLSWIETDPLPLLLIFDGLDEVARPDGAGLEVTQRFLQTLRSCLDHRNGGAKKARLMALALGRPQAAEESIRKVGGLSDRALLHAMPLCPLDEARFRDLGRNEISLSDPKELASEDHRQTFWKRYRCFDPSCLEDEAPKALASDDLAEMTSEPLLLYLLFFSGMDWRKAGVNRNSIYQAIFEEIHNRDLKKPHGHRSKAGLEKLEDFFALMECLGLAAWIGGGRTGTDKAFAIIRDDVYITKYKARFKGMKSAELRNIAVQAFTHRGDGDQPGYAFIHKSFGEYLTARALIEASAKWLTRHEGDPDGFAMDWLQLTGEERLTKDIFRFMIDEVRLISASIDLARSKVTEFAEIASHTLAHGFPAHRDLLTHPGNADWRRREISQRNAEIALYAVLQAWAEVGYPRALLNKDGEEGGWRPGAIKIKWPKQTSSTAAEMINRLRAQWRNDNVMTQLFVRWDFGAGKAFDAINLAYFDLRGADLRGANCSRLDIDSARLQFAKLSTAVNLEQAQIDKAFGNLETDLPDSIERPSHWTDDN